MNTNGQSSAAEYFNTLAPQWDSRQDLESLRARLDSGLKQFGLRPDEHVLDVGCGTGNLTAAILRQLSPSGKITAVDISSRMIEIARSKVNDSRVQWICDSIENTDAFENTFDRVICYSVWPHLVDQRTVAKALFGKLTSGGRLHIWHLLAREAVNKIHSEASEALRHHVLSPAAQVGALLEQSGFFIEELRDDDTGYLVTARKVSS
jgi:ubiquinone/menaquinone biosynthesis C-methylase UbiE